MASTVSFGAALQGADLWLTLLTNCIGFALMQGALQAGRGVVVVPIFSVLSNLVPIVGGIVVFGESMGDNSSGVILRGLAFVLALGGAGLLAVLGEQTPASDSGSHA